MHIDVVGGLYAELCIRPAWTQLYGSAGRAAVAIASMETEVTLHTYATEATVEDFNLVTPWLPARVTLEVTRSNTTVGFKYLHDFANPVITGVPASQLEPIHVVADRIVRFGMLEGDAVVAAEWAVYDPQKAGANARFSDNGSTAKHLALQIPYEI
jgi:hypothetical protein